MQVFTVLQAPDRATMLSVGDPQDVYSRVEADTAHHLSLQSGDTCIVPPCNRVYITNTSPHTGVWLVGTSIYTLVHETAVARCMETLGLIEALRP